MAPSWTTFLLAAAPLSASRHPLLCHHYVAEQLSLQDPPVLCRAPPHHFDGWSAQSPLRFLLRPLSCSPDLSADKLSPRAVPCVFLGFPPDAPGWQFYHPTSRRVLSSQDVTFDESVHYYRLFPYRTASLPPPPLFLAPGPPPVDPLPPQGPAPSGVSQVDAVEPVEVAVDSGAATGAEPVGVGSGGAGSGGAETEGAETGGAETGGPEPGGSEPGGTETWGAEPGGAATGGTEPGGAEPGVTEPGGAGSTRVASHGASSRREVLSPQELREWFARRWSRAAGAGGTTATTCSGGAGAVGPGGPAEAAGVGPPGDSAGASGGTGAAGSAGPAVAGATGVGAAGGVGAGGSAGAGSSEGTGAGGATGAGAPAVSPGAVPAGSGGTPRPRPCFVPLLEHVLGLPPSPGPAPSFECPQPVQSQSLPQPVSPLPAPSPYTGPTGGLAERRAPASRPASPARPACTSRRTSRPRPPAVPGTHQMALHPSTAPLRVPLPSPHASSLPAFPDPETDSLRAASPSVARFLATVVTDPSLASTAASALVPELVEFAARCRLDYDASLVAESASVCPPSVGGECALSTDVLKDRQEEFQCFAAALPHLVSTLLAPEGDPDAPDIPTPRSYAEAIEGPYSSQWQAAMDAEMASWKSTGTYVDEVPPPGVNIVSGMWIFRVKRPPGSPPVFKALGFFAAALDTPGDLQREVRDRGHADASWADDQATQRSSQGYTFSFGSGSVSWRSTRSSSVLSSSCEAEIYAGAMAAQELRWLTYLLTDLGEQPRSPPVLYVDNKAMLALCREHRLEHRTKHIALRYFLARELQQRGQLRLAYVASEANTAHIFTKALAPSDHQRFCTLLACFALLDWSCDLLFSPTLPMGVFLLVPNSFASSFIPVSSHDRALHYFVSTPTIGLTYYKNATTPTGLVGYVDADHASDSDNRRSRTGYIYRLKSIGPISWQSSKQELIALSSAEAEYIALCSATKEGLYLRELLEEAKLAEFPNFTLFCDNQSAIRIANKSGFANRTKRIALRYFFVKDEIEKGRLKLSYCPTSEMAADYLTKKLGKSKFEYCMLLTGQSHVTCSDTREAKGSVGNNKFLSASVVSNHQGTSESEYNEAPASQPSEVEVTAGGYAKVKGQRPLT
ncbi:unnamed protein product [Closterium sp. NIES-53]